MATESSRSIKIFYCYADADEDSILKDELEKHLGALKRLGKITTWHNRKIQAGLELKREIDTHLDTTDIVLLLVSPDFIHSDYCYGIEMQRALERHRTGEVRVIPIILRPVDYEGTSIGQLQILPSDRKAVTSWPNRDEAFMNVVKGIRQVVTTLLAQTEEASQEINERQQHKKQTINRHEAIQLFHQLMQPDSSLRILCLAGDGKLGKSHLLTKVFPSLIQQQYQAQYAILDLRNRLQTVPDILDMICVQLGTENCAGYSATRQALTNSSTVEREPVHALASIYNNPAKRSFDDIDRHLTTQFVNDLNKLNNTPLVLVFDTVNAASESIQTWLMEIFLLHTSRLPHLRVIVAGRSLPEAYGSYAVHCDRYQLTPVTDEEEYIGYCRSLNVQLHDEAIKAFASYVDYIPGTFVDCILPKFVQRRIFNG